MKWKGKNNKNSTKPMQNGENAILNEYAIAILDAILSYKKSLITKRSWGPLSLHEGEKEGKTNLNWQLKCINTSEAKTELTKRAYAILLYNKFVGRGNLKPQDSNVEKAYT